MRLPKYDTYELSGILSRLPGATPKQVQEDDELHSALIRQLEGMTVELALMWGVFDWEQDAKGRDMTPSEKVTFLAGALSVFRLIDTASVPSVYRRLLAELGAEGEK